MASRLETTQAVVTALRRHKILTFDEIRQISQWSHMTMWRRLKPIGYYNSFNHNARYYTLAETPEFDENGLWFYRTVGFSSYGNLTRTVAGLVNNSPMGMTPNEVAALLHVRVQNQLFYLSVQEDLDRIAWGRGYLYVSVDDIVGREQRRRREAHRQAGLALEAGEAPLTDAETIAILVELVRARSSSARGIAVVLSARGLNVTREKVLEVIRKFDLQKKGRLGRSRRSR
jgi:hypothetical protein